MLHIKLLLSPYANAIVKSIDSAEAESMPGVIKVYSWVNTPKIRYNSAIFYPGQTDLEDETLFSEHMRYVGDRVAAVVAESKEAAEEGMNRLKVEYDELIPLLDPVKALDQQHEERREVNLSCGDIEKIKGDTTDLVS